MLNFFFCQQIKSSLDKKEAVALIVEENLGFTKMVRTPQTQNLDTATEIFSHETLREEAIRYIQRNYMGSFAMMVKKIDNKG